MKTTQNGGLKRGVLKAASSKESWRATRERYTWHLRPPFNEEFDRSHWWENRSDIEPIAALYELVRRHPAVGKTLLKMKGQPESRLLDEPAAIHCLSRIGMKSWQELDGRNRDYWNDSVGRVKGLDFRHELEQCVSITRDALTELVLQPHLVSSYLAKQKGEKMPELPAPEFPLPPSEVEKCIAQSAVDAHRRGMILLAIVPDLKANVAAALLANRYRQHDSLLRLHRRLNTERKQRARWENWLPIIATFEDGESNKGGGAKSSVFTAYRRALDGVRFTSLQPLV